MFCFVRAGFYCHAHFHPIHLTTCLLRCSLPFTHSAKRLLLLVFCFVFICAGKRSQLRQLQHCPSNGLEKHTVSQVQCSGSSVDDTGEMQVKSGFIVGRKKKIVVVPPK